MMGKPNYWLIAERVFKALLGLMIGAAVVGIGLALGRPQPAEVAVENSAWDGSVRQVKRWVQANIADPEAEVRKWGKVYRSDSGHLQVDAVIGGRNLLGGYIAKPYRFRFSDKGVILKAAPVEEW